MKYELSEQVKNNITIFLDRCPIQGFKEVQALQEIINILNSPIKTSIEEKNNKQ